MTAWFRLYVSASTVYGMRGGEYSGDFDSEAFARRAAINHMRDLYPSATRIRTRVLETDAPPAASPPARGQ